jgi:hypothetical protein
MRRRRQRWRPSHGLYVRLDRRFDIERRVRCGLTHRFDRSSSGGYDREWRWQQRHERRRRDRCGG